MASKAFRKISFVIIFLTLCAACMPGFNLMASATQTPLAPTATIWLLPTSTSVPPDPSLPTPIPPTAEPVSQGLDNVKLYLVAIGDNGGTGTLIGCGDSLVPVDVRITPTLGVLRAALNELFKLEGQQYYGQSGLYNALYQSDLVIEDVAVVGSEARIVLTGTLTLGGVCDGPRLEEQLKALALQFSTVERVSIYINGESLEDVLSLK